MAFSTDVFELAQSVLARARGKGFRIACAESCTGGLVAAALTEVPGSSGVFAGGVVSYMLDIKEHILGVSPSILYDPSIGAVSPECALAMAQGVSEALRADVTVSVTGIAGPGGGTAEKPVGLVYIASAGKGKETKVTKNLFSGTREEIRMQATEKALTMLIEQIEE